MGVEDQGPRLLLRRGRRRDALHDSVEESTHALARLRGDLQNLFLVHTEQLDDFLGDGGNVGYGQVYLVDDGDDLQVVLHSEVQVGERLGLYTLASVHDKQRSLTGGYGARDLVGEVNVTWGVYEVERPLPIGAVIEEADGLGLDGYTPLALQVHGVEDLGHPLPLGNGVGRVK